LAITFIWNQSNHRRRSVFSDRSSIILYRRLCQFSICVIWNHCYLYRIKFCGIIRKNAIQWIGIHLRLLEYGWISRVYHRMELNFKIWNLWRSISLSLVWISIWNASFIRFQYASLVNWFRNRTNLRMSSFSSFYCMQLLADRIRYKSKCINNKYAYCIKISCRVFSYFSWNTLCLISKLESIFYKWSFWTS